MKIALYIEDGLEQIVLTPQSDTEKAVLSKLHDADRSFELKRGSFFQCRGGYVRHEPQWHTPGMYTPSESQADDSTMIVLRKVQHEDVQQ